MFYGSNDGVFRAINGNQPLNGSISIGSSPAVPPGGELWGFVPTEFYAKLTRLYTNSPMVQLSTTPNGFNPDADAKGLLLRRLDGRLPGYGESTVSLFMSARRGGRFIYALNVNNPDGSRSSCGRRRTRTYAELGYTWSLRRRRRVSAGTTNPVVIFAGGYDPIEDDRAARHRHDGPRHLHSRRHQRKSRLEGRVLRRWRHVMHRQSVPALRNDLCHSRRRHAREPRLRHQRLRRSHLCGRSGRQYLARRPRARRVRRRRQCGRVRRPGRSRSSLRWAARVRPSASSSIRRTSWRRRTSTWCWRRPATASIRMYNASATSSYAIVNRFYGLKDTVDRPERFRRHHYHRRHEQHGRRERHRIDYGDVDDVQPRDQRQRLLHHVLECRGEGGQCAGDDRRLYVFRNEHAADAEHPGMQQPGDRPRLPDQLPDRRARATSYSTAAVCRRRRWRGS